MKTISSSSESAMPRHPGSRFFLTAVAALIIIIPHCAPKEKYRPIDYNLRVPVPTVAAEKQSDRLPRLTVAIASIYSARESLLRFQELFSAIGKRCSVSMDLRYCKNYREAFLLFKTDSSDIGIVSPSLFILGRRAKIMRLLAVPEINGKTTFQAYLIVPKKSSAQRFDDLKNSGFAFTDSLSLAGYFYPLHCTLMGMEFWHETVFAGSYDIALDLVNRNIVDGASIASWVFDYFNARFPEKTANTRIIEKSMEFGLPPIVIGNRVDTATALSLKNTFLSLSSDSAGTALLHAIGMKRFVAAPESLYESAERMVPESAVQ